LWTLASFGNRGALAETYTTLSAQLAPLATFIPSLRDKIKKRLANVGLPIHHKWQLVNMASSDVIERKYAVTSDQECWNLPYP
jgi:hypothetical protein